MVVGGICQIPDPLYKLIGSIVSFYIPLGVMLLTYALTVRLLAEQRQNLGGGGKAGSSGGTGWASGWLGQPTPGMFNHFRLFKLSLLILRLSYLYSTNLPT